VTQTFTVKPLISALLALLVLGCTQAADPLQRLQRSDPVAADDAKLLIVHCLVPGQVRRLGAFSQGISPRRALKVNADECTAQGGEFIAPNADPIGALKFWLPFANEGDLDAQVTVGELYERAADPTVAASWYEKAVTKGSTRAMVNLAALADRGQGMPRSTERARELMRRASGFIAGAQKPRIQLIDPPSFVSAMRMRGASLALPVPSSGTGPVMLTGRAESAAGIAEVKVNGEARPVESSGLFSAPVRLAAAPVAMTITATDRAGQSASIEFNMLPRGAAAVAPAVASANAPISSGGGERYALIIANQNYKHWDKLDTPLADGKAVAEMLSKRFGFEATVITDATRRQVLTALNQLRAKVDSQDEVLIYYAGHGEMDAVTARGYWIPVDGEQKNLTQWISVIDITDQLAAMQARHALVIADSCYSGTLSGSLAQRVDDALNEQAQRGALDRLSRQRARVAITSGGLEPVVDGGGGKNSLYARSLLEVLTHVQTPIEAQELHAAVAARFAFLSRRLKLPQQPQYAPIGFAGHESGDFILRPVVASVSRP
jgi:uncharacterized protein